MNKIKKVMNRIGFLGLFLAVFLSISCNCQNFFWSHTGPNTTRYGLLYNWYAATDARKISSSDEWVVPNSTQRTTLVTYIGGYAVGGGKLKETGTNYWYSPNTGATNEYGFNARGAGVRGTNSLKYSTYYWRIEESSATNANTIHLTFNSKVFGNSTTYKTQGNSIRLVRTSTTLSHGQTGTYTGNDGKVYKTICIGTQEWLADNLAETRFRNGDIIPWYGANKANFYTNAEWVALTTAACCAYNNYVNNVALNFSFPDY